MQEGYRSGFVALVGRPNVGKSTLLNALLGRKVSIVSDKPQTTRNKIRGVLTGTGWQVVFLDTPGIHKPLHKLGQYMVRVARSALNEVDLILFLVEAGEAQHRGDRYIAGELARVDTPKVLVVNKVDLIPPEKVGEVADSFRSLGEFERVFAVSAVNGKGLEELVKHLPEVLPEGPQYYPDEWVTDHPEQFVAGELIREKVLLLTREEIPHSVAVVVEEMARRDDKDLVDILATIYVERDSQKGIIIGKGGRMLKEIGTLARNEIEALLGSSVNLQLWVKVKRDWREREGDLKNLGYRME